MLAALVTALGLVALGAWGAALLSAIQLWRSVPKGNRLRNLLSPAWLQIDTIGEIAGPEGAVLARRYVWALVLFFIAFAGLVAVLVAIFVTGRGTGVA